MGTLEENTQHLFIVRIWTDPAQSPPTVTRGLIEHVPTGERRYFLELREMQAFVAQSLSERAGQGAGGEHTS